MRKYIKWGGIILLSPIVLFVLLCILLYIPPVQNFIVKEATLYASRATGMQIRIRRIALAFPLDLAMHHTQVVNHADTLLDAGKLTLKIQFLPLFQKRVEVDGIRVENASLNTADLIKGMSLEGRIGEVFLNSHAVELSPSTAVINQFKLKNTRLALSLTDTTATDTAASPPLYWRIKLEKASLQNVAFHLAMPLDSLAAGMRVGSADLSGGVIDLRKEAYSLRSFRLSGGSAYYRSGNKPRAASGFDPSHVDVDHIRIGIDSLHYDATQMRALIRHLEMKEHSGIEVISTHGELAANGHVIRIPSLQLKTAGSYLSGEASIDRAALSDTAVGNVRARLLVELGKGDLLKLLPDLPADFIKHYPSAPLRLHAGLDGTTRMLRLTALNVELPGAFRLNANGKAHNPMDSVRRKAELLFEAQAGDTRFIQALTGGLLIPSGTTLKGMAGLRGQLADTELALQQDSGKISLMASYDMHRQAYRANLEVDRLNIDNFLPGDSLYTLTASFRAEGKGLDVFAPLTTLKADGGISHFRYGKSKIFSGIHLQAGMSGGKANISCGVTDNLMDISARLEALLRKRTIDATLHTEVKRIDWYDMHLTKNPLKSSQQIQAHLFTDLKQTHSLQASMTQTKLITEKKTYAAKDLHLGGKLSRDSVKSYVNAGDLTLLFKAKGSMDHLTRSLSRLSEEWARQWKNKHIDQPKLKKMLPDACFRIVSGKDNPIANLLAVRKIGYRHFMLDLDTSSKKGMNGEMFLYGLHTDSLQLDTIYFTTAQEPEKVVFKGGVKANAYPKQEAFDVSLQGDLSAEQAHAMIEYLNGKKQRGAYIGFVAQLHKNGISLRVSPDKPTLVYRQFTANEDNYVYLSDQGRIHANLRLYDDRKTGINFYSTPDSTVQQDLTLALNRISMAEFRRIIPYMPDISGLINAEAHYVQASNATQVSLEVGVDSLAYLKQPMGNWAASAVYLPKETGEHYIDGFLTRNDDEIASLNGSYFAATEGEKEGSLSATLGLNHVPLAIANAFIPDRMAILGGDMDGKLQVTGMSSAPILNGELMLDNMTTDVPQASINLRFDNHPVQIEDNRMLFRHFKLYSKGKSPFTIDGDVNFQDMANPLINLKMDATNFELMNAKRTKESLVYGKIYADFHSVLKGNVNVLTLRGDLNLRGGSDFTYLLKDSPLTVEDRLGETVTFVNFKDTTTLKHPEVALQLGGMDMLMNIHIDEAVQCRVNLTDNGSNYMLLEGGGDLSFQYTPEGNMYLNGRYTLMSGEMKYEMPVIPLKTFQIKNGSYVQWTGNVMNPQLNIMASERVRASVSDGGKNQRMVNFDVGVAITNRLENLGFTFTLDAPDDGSIQNELAAKSVEEKNKLAVTMLVTGMYWVEGNTTGEGFNANSALNSFLQSEINSIAGNALKSIDVKFGMESTDPSQTGESRTDYNFQFAKRFWNNRIQVVIGGKISTGNNVNMQDESFIDNISLEYRLDNSGTRYVKIFHDKNYESILDGEVIETGAGIVLRRKVSKLGELFIFRNRKKKTEPQNITTEK